MNKINADWHRQNQMPKNPTIDERVKWHLNHTENCHCREMPESIKELIKNYTIKKTAK